MLWNRVVELIMDIRKIKKELKDNLDKSRYEHTIGVAYTAASLAMRYEVDLNKALIAGFLHDCAKCIPDDKKVMECKKYDVEISDIEMENKSLLHSKLGMVYANVLYDVDDDDILNSILYHTTGRPNMSILEKIIFIADYIEPGRDKAENLSIVRPLAFADIDECMYIILRDTLEYLKTRDIPIDNMTENAYNFYKDLHNNKELD